MSAEDVRLGRPEDPSPAQVRLHKSRQGLERFERPWTVAVTADRSLNLSFFLPLFAISLMEIESVRGARSNRPGRSGCGG